MATLDSSIVNIALPTLTKEFGAGLYQIKWVVIIYLLGITCVLLPFGRLSDLYGRKRMMLIGFSVFVSGSLLCGLAPSLGWLVVFRLVQGLGAAMLMANGPAIITASFVSGERGKALGILAMVVSAGLISGPSVGGLLITTLGWRSIFFLNIPIGMVAWFLAREFLPKDALPKKASAFDWPGSLLQMLFLLSFIVLMEPPAISISGSEPLPISRWVLIVLCAILGLLFVRFEQQSKSPLLDFSLFRIRTFSLANLAGFLTFVSFSAVSVLIPFFCEEVLGLTPDRAGLLMTSIPLTILIVAPISGRLSDKVGTHGLSALGALVGAITLFWMAGATGFGLAPDVSRVAMVLALCGIGLSTGLFQSPNNSALMNDVPPAKLGIASAILATVRNLGLVTGTGLSVAIFSWRHAQTGDYTEAVHLSLYVAGSLSLGAMAASLQRGRTGRLGKKP
jgi:EmrB/QacA subfamily drug resistance transporter